MEYLVFDIGGTFTKYCVSDASGTCLTEGSFPTPTEDFSSLLEAMRQILYTCGRQSFIRGVAVSSPGAVDSEAGIIHGISALDYIHGFPIRDAISDALCHLPVSIENDANCAALGELWLGAAKGRRHVAFVVCGTGIGGAVIIDGRLHKGSTMNGGEFGNFLVQKEADGRRHTWSDYTIVKQARKYTQQTGRQTDGRELMALSSAGDPLAWQLVDEFYEIMALGCYNINFTLDTEMILLGGGVSESELLIPNISKKMEALADGDRFGYLTPQLRTCMYGSKANLYGALYHFMDTHPQTQAI